MDDRKERLSAEQRYVRLSSTRQQFLDIARDCAKLTLPYLLPPSGHSNGVYLPTPWQSVGAKGVNVMASKLMLALFPINQTFFKLQINDGQLAKDPELDMKARSEIDTVLSKMERVVMQNIAETADRVIISQAMRHLVTTGNALLFMGNKGLKMYPLDRYVVNRDGDGNVIEIVTLEAVPREQLPDEFQMSGDMMPGNHVGEGGGGNVTGDLIINPDLDEAALYTWVTLENGRWSWYQEVDGKPLPTTESSAPKNSTPWIPLRFQMVDGESYGRGRVEEFLGDLRSLDSLMQSIVEGSSAAAKVVFLVSPSSTTKPKQLAEAHNGTVIQGRPDEVGVVQVGKTADFKTAYDMINMLTQRLSDAFLSLNVRDSERTTAEEIRSTKSELDEQLGGIYSSLTIELLTPYLNRKLSDLQRKKELPKLPKDLVFPTVVAGLSGVGRGQDLQALTGFIQTLGQTIGPDKIPTFVNLEEFTKRLATSAGIDQLNLIKTAQERQQEQQAAQQAAQQQSLMDQAGQIAGSPVMDPSKNPGILEQIPNANAPQEAGSTPQRGAAG